MDDSSPVPSSKHRACLRCASSKAKCAVTEGRKGCDRCARLRRECIFDVVRRRQKRKNTTKVEKLEEKVEGLLALLAPSEIRPHGSNAIWNLSTPAATEDTGSPLDDPDPSAKEACPDIIDRGLLTLSIANDLLEDFKINKTPQFPFVIVPPETNATTLRRQSPFLFLTIVTAGLENDHSLQKRLALEVKTIISQRLIIEDERNLDLLQGLLVHVCWYHYHFHPTSRHMHMFMQMALTMVSDLGLDRCQVHSHYDQGLGGGAGLKQSGSPTRVDKNERSRKAAEKRALLGCYYLSSLMSLLRKRISMAHTKWIDQCCHLLEKEKEYHSDIFLRSFVEARSITHRIGEAFSFDPDQAARQAPHLLEMSINNFRQEVAQLKAHGQSNMEHQSHALVLELKALAVSVHEVALYQLDSLLHANLWTLLISCRELVAYSVNIPTEELRHLPSASFTLFLQAFACLSNVARLPSRPGWDGAIANKEAAVNELGKQYLDKFESLTRTGWKADFEKRDGWSYMRNGMAGLLAWLKKQDMQDEDTGRIALTGIPSVTGAPLGSCCAMGDIITSCTTLVKQNLFKDAAHNNGNDRQGSVAALNGTAQGDQDDRQEELPQIPWDDAMWQFMLEDYTGFPPVPLEEYQRGSYATL